MYLEYLSYVVRHKWYVFIESVRLGIPARGILHDASKFRPDEFFPYARSFYGPERTQEVTDAFDLAWLKHQKRNPHHWQYWVCPQDDGGDQILEMPLGVRKEMLADWIGAGKAQGKPGTKAWYAENRNKMRLGPETRQWIEDALGVIVVR